MAHFTALAAARDGVLRTAGWSVEADGLFGAPRVRVLANATRHGSVDRALRFLGIGERTVCEIPTDDDGRVTEASLKSSLDANPGPKIVVLAAGDLNTGVCDSFRTLIPIAKAAGAWVHVDGAFGLMARASKTKRHMVDGVELADSWAADAHKWINVPYDSGIAIVKHREAHYTAMTVHASYLEASHVVRDEIDWNPDSRAARAGSRCTRRCGSWGARGWRR